MNRMHSPSLPAFGETPSDRSIGAILIDAGRLSPADAESILRFQKQHGSRFGDAAVELGLLSREDIRFALARQFDYPCLTAGDPDSGRDPRPDGSLVAAYRPDVRIVEQLRGLRSQLMLRWFEAARAGKALAVVGASRREGRSFIAANLAVVFSQLGERTLLIDTRFLDQAVSLDLLGVDLLLGLDPRGIETKALGELPEDGPEPIPHDQRSGGEKIGQRPFGLLERQHMAQIARSLDREDKAWRSRPGP